MKEFEPKYFFLKIIDNIHIPDNLTEDETIRGNFIRLIKPVIYKAQVKGIFASLPSREGVRGRGRIR